MVVSARLEELSALPETASELNGIAKVVGADLAKDVFIGRQATEERVKTTQLNDRKLVMFATHGLVSGDIDGLRQPALALSNPKLTGDKNNDGLLTLEEILSLQLDADWVVLSACNTAAADGAGAEAVSGLGRAFFYAGTRSLLATHWPVESKSAELLTQKIFQHQAAGQTTSRAESLRFAMKEIMQNTNMQAKGQTVATYAHPVFWAPFTLYGNGR